MVHYDPKNRPTRYSMLPIAQGVLFIVMTVVFFGLEVFFSGAFR